MIEININKVKKNYGFTNILDDLSFDIKTGEKIALIGSNGCGKTTTFNLIMGESYDSGNITIRKDSTIMYLKQIPDKENSGVKALDVYLRGIKELLDLQSMLNEHSNNMSDSKEDIIKLNKLQEEFEIKGGYQLNEKINRIKTGFKLTEDLLNTEYNSLSGGEKTIVSLASIMLSNPDILLLDEPTNHLDIETLEWFEEYLKNYKGTVLIISHDRYFLDHVINKIICLEHGHADIYHGNYSYYLEESEKRLLLEFQKYKNQQKEIKAMEEVIARLKTWGIKSDNPIFFRRAASIQKRLDKLVKIDKPVEKKELPIIFKNDDRTGNEVLKINNLNLIVGNKELLVKSNLMIRYQDRVCLMGKNGSGKTTLIKKIMENNDPSIILGTNTSIGYIPQEIRFDKEYLTIYEYVRSIFVGDETELRKRLFQFYFGEESLKKKIKYISGGEKVRIKLLELLINNVNILILDEPTNHIDIETKEILENALLDFKGTIIFISHDRYFVNKIATRVVRIEDKKLISYEGNYDYVKSKEYTKEIVPVKKEIVIKGSNRLNEFLKDSKIEEITIGCSNKKVYRIKKKSKTSYLKIANHLSQESIRLDYLQDKITVPKKIFYEKYNNMSYLLTTSLNGKMLCDEYYVNNPLEGIKIIVEAFNSLYNIDYSDCVIDETMDVKIKRIEERFNKIESKDIDSMTLKRFINKEGILKYLKGNKPKQIIGFTHGDMSLPNIFGSNGHFSGLLDVDECGMSDIYYDIVVCEISIERNYGKEYIDIFYNELGIEKDEFKSDYYRVLLSI